MGTNYYLINKCSCGEMDKDKLHLGKSSVGWAFSFRGYKKGCWETLPPNNVEQVTNIEEWEDLILQNTWSVYDEYDQEQNPFKFIEFVKTKQGVHHAEVVDSNYDKMVNGYSFTFREFS